MLTSAPSACLWANLNPNNARVYLGVSVNAPCVCFGKSVELPVVSPGRAASSNSKPRKRAGLTRRSMKGHERDDRDFENGRRQRRLGQPQNRMIAILFVGRRRNGIDTVKPDLLPNMLHSWTRRITVCLLNRKGREHRRESNTIRGFFFSYSLPSAPTIPTALKFLFSPCNSRYRQEKDRE